jgi:GAF domain-containing protein
VAGRWRGYSPAGKAERVDDLTERFRDLPAAPWGEPARQAMVLPVARLGVPQPTGVLVLGISARRTFDDDYRGFFDLVAGHVATAVANARAYEAERVRAEALAALDRVRRACRGMRGTRRSAASAG